MSAIRLLVLSAVRQHGRAHGYQVRADLEFWGAHEWSNAKPGSIYHALKKMAKAGLLTATETVPSDVGGPPRVEYALTHDGEREYVSLARAALITLDEADVFTAGVGCMVDLQRDDVIDLLGQRIAGFEEWKRSVTNFVPPEGAPSIRGHIDEITGLWVHTAQAGADWTVGLLERIRQGAYVFAGEGEPFRAVVE